MIAKDSNDRLKGFSGGDVLTELKDAVIAAIVLLPPNLKQNT